MMRLDCAAGMVPCDPATLNQSAKRGHGMKDAGRPGAGTAPDEREVRESSECDRPSDFLGHKAMLCFINRAAGWEGGAGGRRRGPIAGGPAAAGAGNGAG